MAEHAEGRVVGYGRLAVAVIERAYLDRHFASNLRLRIQGEAFFERESPDLAFWCRAAHATVPWVRRAARKPPDTRYPFPGQRSLDQRVRA